MPHVRFAFKTAPQNTTWADMLAVWKEADDLDRPTPCPAYTLGDLIDHVGGLALAFTAAARKQPGDHVEQTPSGRAANLESAWRARIPADLATLARARSVERHDEDRGHGRAGRDGGPDRGRRARRARLGRGPRDRAAVWLRARSVRRGPAVPRAVRQP